MNRWVTRHLFKILVMGLLCSGCGASSSPDKPVATPDSKSDSSSTTSTITTTSATAGELTFFLTVASSGAEKRQILHEDKIAQAEVGSDVTMLVKGPDIFKSVQFKFDGNTNYRLDNSSPFTLTANDAAPFAPLNLKKGSHILTAEAYSETAGAGVLLESQSIVFTIF